MAITARSLFDALWQIEGSEEASEEPLTPEDYAIGLEARGISLEDVGRIITSALESSQYVPGKGTEPGSLVISVRLTN